MRWPAPRKYAQICAKYAQKRDFFSEFPGECFFKGSFLGYRQNVSSIIKGSKQNTLLERVQWHHLHMHVKWELRDILLEEAYVM